MAAKVDPADEAYYEHAIAPLIRDTPLVEFVGEVDERQKDALLGGAYAYLFPIDWPEPFGLTMVEAMATGTPVVAYRVGSVPEVGEAALRGMPAPSLLPAPQGAERLPSMFCSDAVTDTRLPGL